MNRLDPTLTASAAMKALALMASSCASRHRDRQLLVLVKAATLTLTGGAHGRQLCARMAQADAALAEKLAALPYWRHAPVFSQTERAALRWIHCVAEARHQDVSDTEYTEARRHFSEEELADLTMVAIAMTAWNQIARTFGPPGCARGPEDIP